MTHTIEVTKSDIRAAKRSRHSLPSRCPIEIAARRAFKQEVVAAGNDMLLALGNGAVYDLPPEAQAFAEVFDFALDSWDTISARPITFVVTERNAIA